MLKLERLERICDYVAEHKYASVRELSDLLDASPATVRRDIGTLAQQKRVIVSHGGIAYNDAKISEEAPYSIKTQSYIEEKNRIAQAASAYIEPHSTLMIDAGTTTLCLAPFIKEIEGLNVVTNDVAMATSLANWPGGSVTVIGGILRSGYCSVIGHHATRMVENMRADLCIIGTDAVSTENGCMISNMDEVGIKQELIGASRRVIIICDHSKFERESFVSFCDLDQVDMIITGEDIDPHIREELEARDVQVVIAGETAAVREA